MVCSSHRLGSWLTLTGAGVLSCVLGANGQECLHLEILWPLKNTQTFGIWSVSGWLIDSKIYSKCIC